MDGETGPGTGKGPGPGTGKRPETGARTGKETGTDTGAGTGEETVQGAGADTGARTGKETGAGTGADEELVPGRTVTRLADAKALRAYAHPVRMKLIRALRTRGPLTATQAGRLLGESSGTCSFHLRQLAKYGLVEETGEGTGREKPWRATTTSTAWDDVQRDPEAAAAAGLLIEVLAESYFTQLMQYLEVRDRESEEWQRAAMIGDRILWLTADELTGMQRGINAVTDQYFERTVKPELRPPGARLVTVVNLGFPSMSLRDES
jgi:DNA-binding transcriptional ArsR family regulator